MDELKRLSLSLRSLAVFRDLAQDSLMQRFFDLTREGQDMQAQVDAYAAFAAEVYKKGGNLTECMLRMVLSHENCYVTRKVEDKPVPDGMQKAVRYELTLLDKLAHITPDDVRPLLAYQGFLPEWEVSDASLSDAFENRIAKIRSCGFGMYAEHAMFALRDGEIVPILSPDPVRLCELSSYQTERQAVVDNTRALLQGLPAANVLLYGDAGTGKSSTVKAVVNEFWQEGLRLIELTKKQLRMIPLVLDRLSRNPLKFILFIDDLSFSQDDDDFAALKAVLEGSAAAKASNLVVYATSNRRHLVKEYFSNREGDDIHRNDTLQELFSLSERFGLTITFSRPDREQYFEVVRSLLDRYGIKRDMDEMFQKAERFALSRGGRSPRVARQFAQYVKAGEIG